LKMKKLKSFGLLVCVLAVAAPAFGADGDNVRDLVQAYRVWKLTDVLDLSEDQMPVFFARIKEIDNLEADLLQEQREVVKRLKDILDEREIDQRKLDQALEDYRTLRQRRIEDVGRLRDDAEMMLSAEQRARFIVFDQEFRSDIRNIIEKARDLERQRRMDEQMDRWDSGLGSPGGRSGVGGDGGRGRR
jgi:parvulin-like peptidyl-prolyl isomerase